MGGILYGHLSDLKPIIRCRIAAVAPADETDYPTAGVEVSALVDTGATDLCVKADLVASLGLTPLPEMVVSDNVGGSSHSPAYMVHVILPMARVLAPSQPFHYLISDARALGTIVPGADIILGMNVLSQLEMRFGPGPLFSLFKPLR